MLSDTLFQAVEEIEQYQQKYPENFAPILEAIEKVKGIIYVLGMALDLNNTKHKKLAKDITNALGNLDISGIKNLMLDFVLGGLANTDE